MVGSAGPYAAPKARLEVRGYVLARDGAIPRDARAYAVVAFRQASEAQRFCPAFRARLDFEGALVSGTDLTVTSRGLPVEIAPMIWPVTSWGAADRPDCATLVARYDYAGARAFLQEARRSLAPLGLATTFNATSGPFIISARRSGSLTVYDLSRAPDADYDRWLVQTVDGIESGVSGPAVVAPGWRDQMRFYAFSAVPSIEAALDVFVPGYAKARAGN